MNKILTESYHLLLEVMQKLSLARDLDTIMFLVRRTARTLAQADGATFILRDNGQCFYADEEAIAPLWKSKRFPMERCVSGWVMAQGESVVIEDIYQDARVPIDAYRPTFVKSLAVVPIRTSNPIGAIGVYWAENYKATDDQINLLNALANSTAIALENIQLQSQVEKGIQDNSAQLEITQELINTNERLENNLNELNYRHEEMKWLKDLSSTLQTCLYLEEAYQLVAQYVSQLLPGSAGIFYLMHPSRNYLEAMTSWGKPNQEEKIIKPNECLALRRGNTYSIENSAQAHLYCQHGQNAETLYTCVPLFAQSDIQGLLYVEWQGDALQPYANRLMLADMIAEQISLGISNIKLRETLRNQSFSDALTGLYNRRYLEETLERELSRCALKASNLAVLMIDIDHFKQFNDQFGHEAGDTVIQAFANTLRQCVRNYDIACRYGGEEFVVILSDVDVETAQKRAEALRNAVTQLHLRYGGQALKPITISIGIAIFPDDGNNLKELLQAADKALYQAKNNGRNQTIVFKKESDLSMKKMESHDFSNTTFRKHEC